MLDYIIAPSILSADFTRLGEEVRAVLAAGADAIHFDVMDHHYVPNLTVGPLVCQSLRQAGITAPIDVHLMTKPVDDLIIAFAKAGADWITIHPQATEHLDRSLQLILDHGCQAGIALNPATPWQGLDYVVDKLSMMLIMSVNPGFGGQAFIDVTLDKIAQVHQWRTAHQYAFRLAVDGGVNISNIGRIAHAGADTFVAGSAIFGAPDYAEVIAQMRQILVNQTEQKD
ncbi:MAG: ribulose-phosphate 3-epimerase [Legionellales bacterium]|nr:ribulose-phosphate 3-epimerase [Legionellales bacterium]